MKQINIKIYIFLFLIILSIFSCNNEIKKNNCKDNCTYLGEVTCKDGNLSNCIKNQYGCLELTLLAECKYGCKKNQCTIDCKKDCGSNQHCENIEKEEVCTPNTKVEQCKEISIDNATTLITEVEINWDSDTNSWSKIPNCSWRCNTTYHKEENSCVKDKIVELEIIKKGDKWFYYKGVNEPPTDWKELTFDRTNWEEGESGFGYGDGDDETIFSDMRNNYTTIYLRKNFINKFSAIESAELSIDFDDGFVVYINNQEVARKNIVGEPQYDSTASPDHEASKGDDEKILKFNLDLNSILYNQDNSIQIIVLNVGLNSSDLSMIPTLKIRGYLKHDTQVPVAPTNLDAISVLENQIFLNWKDNSSNEDGFKLERAEDISGEMGEFVEITSLDSNKIKYYDKNLTIGKKYYYRVKTFNEAGFSKYSNIVDIILKESWSFSVIADPRIYQGIYSNALREIKDINVNPEPKFNKSDFLLITGDSDPNRDRYEDYKNIFSNNLLKGYYLVLGNHDFEEEIGKPLIDILSEQTNVVRRSITDANYYFDNRNSRFIIVDAYSTDTGSTGCINELGLNWVEGVINSSNKDHIFIAFHDPAFPRYRHVDSSFNACPEQRDAFWNMLIRHKDKVRAVFVGHTHNYYRMKVKDPSSREANPSTEDAEAGLSLPNDIDGIYQIDAGATGNGSAQNRSTIVRVEIKGKDIFFRVVQAKRYEDSPFYLIDEWSIKE